MVYVALLRGINVGGNNKVDMKDLKTAFEKVGMESVRTYLNTGNVIFKIDKRKSETLCKILESTIKAKFNLEIKVLVHDYKSFKAIMESLPEDWQNNQTSKCDVMFLWKEINTPKVLDELAIRPDIDSVKYVSGALLWLVNRKDQTKSGMMKLVGTKVYKQMTIRNCNTARKIYSIMEELD